MKEGFGSRHYTTGPLRAYDSEMQFEFCSTINDPSTVFMMVGYEPSLRLHVT